MRKLLVLVAFALLMLALPKAALALSATATVSNYSGACPGKVTFSATISGNPNSTVTYAFFYLDPGSGKTITLPSHSATFGGGATVNVSDTGTVTGSGAAWAQLEITSPGLVYSNKASFSVSCAASPPPSRFGNATSARCTACVVPNFDLQPVQTGWLTYEYKWVGVDLTLNESGTCASSSCAPSPLVVGWYHHKTGDSFWLYHQNDFWRSFILFDETKIHGASVKRALLDVPIVSGYHSCIGGVGRATADWRGQVAQDKTFTQNDATNGDFSAHWFATGITGGVIEFDVTPIVQAWASGTPNFGFVVRGVTENNGSDGNDSCEVMFGTNAVLHIQTT